MGESPVNRSGKIGIWAATQNCLSGQLAGYVNGPEKSRQGFLTVMEFQDLISSCNVFSGLFL